MKSRINNVEFWVKIHDLLAGCMSMAIGQHLGNFIGVFLDYNLDNNSEIWRNFI